jgi:hypothetical protein
MVLAEGIWSRWDGVSARIPGRLDELRGPHTGIVVLPVHLNRRLAGQAAVLSRRIRRACERRLGLPAAV